jgi:hypothetical protein
MAGLANVLLFVRSTRRAAHFFQTGLGLSLVHCDDFEAELLAGSVSLKLKSAEGCVALVFTLALVCLLFL